MEVLPATAQDSCEHKKHASKCSPQQIELTALALRVVRALLSSQDYCEDQNDLTEGHCLGAPWACQLPHPTAFASSLKKSVCN